MFPNEAHITNLHMLDGPHNLIQLPIENFSLCINTCERMQVELSRHTHIMKTFVPAVFQHTQLNDEVLSFYHFFSLEPPQIKTKSFLAKFSVS